MNEELATDELRRMLDERGIEHDASEDDTTIFYDVDGNRYTYNVNPESGWAQLYGYNLTPAQAIAATVGRRDTMELWPEWEQVLFANVTDEVAQDNLNECVHELLEKAATVGRSCESCPEMDNPDSYIRHLQSALRWHDEHVPRPTNPRNTCVVLQGEKPPEEVLFVGPDGVTHYQPEDATVGEGTCEWCKDGKTFDEQTVMMTNHGWQKIRHCPNCGKRIEVSE